MKKFLLSVIIAASSTFILQSCGKEDVILANPNGSTNPSDPNGNPSNPNNPNNPGNPNSGAPKCYVTEIKNIDSEGASTITKFVYNAKNVLMSTDEEDGKTTYEYDANNRIIKMNLNSTGIENFTYEYDSKGNMSKIKYFEQGSSFQLDISEYVLSTNSKGQVDKVQAKSEDDTMEFLFEYDGKGNITKIIMNDEGDKYPLVQNLKFDDKSNVYLNTNIAKAYIPHIIVAALFGGNGTSLFNPNNILSDSVFSFFSGDEQVGTYNYGYTAEGFPSKVTVMRKLGTKTTKEEVNYTYSCK